MHIAYYDKNPVGRLVTRVTTDVDALNEMFTSGVVSIFEDIFVLIGIGHHRGSMDWRLALITLAVLPLIADAQPIFSATRFANSYRRIRTAIARINSHLQEHVSGMVVLQLFNREKRAFKKFSEVNELHMDAFKDAIMAHAIYYPVVEFFRRGDCMWHLVWRHRCDLEINHINLERGIYAGQVDPLPDRTYGSHAGGIDSLHPIFAAFFPADPRLE